MPADAKTPEGFSLRRWSRRKLEASREAAPRATEPTSVQPKEPGESVPVAAVPASPAPASPPALPPVESLTIDSDFASFFQPQVDESLKRQALKKLFADPRFNVMDGLDVYIDDYTKSDPIPPDVLERLVKGHFGFNPPAPPPADPTQEPAAERVAVPDSATALPANESIPPGDAADTGPRSQSDDAGCAAPRAAHRTRRRSNESRRQEPASLFLQRDDAARCRGARARARAFRHARAEDDALPEGARRVRRSGGRRRRGRVHAGGAALRRYRGRGRQGADDPLREYPRDRRLVGRSARGHAEDRRAARSRGAARTGAGAARLVPFRGPPADHGAGRRGPPLGGRARSATRRDGGDHRSRNGRRRCRQSGIIRSTRAA